MRTSVSVRSVTVYWSSAGVGRVDANSTTSASVVPFMWMPARAGIHMNGTTDALVVEFASTLPTPALDQYTVTERTLTLVRMSPTYP